MTLRVGVDGGALSRPESGIGRYTLELIRGVATWGEGVDLSVLANRFRGPAAPPTLGGKVRVVNPRIPDRVLKTGWRVAGYPPVEALLGAVDVFHASDWAHPPLRGARMVATVHDLGPVEHPEWYSPHVVRHFQAIHRSVVERAARVIAVSAATRDAFVASLGADPERVRVVHSGISADFLPIPSDAARRVASSHGLKGPYVLYVGTRERRKNLKGLVHAFVRVADEHPEVALALVGARPRVEAAGVQGAEGWTGDELEREVASLGLSERVHVLGMVPRRDLPALYSAASLFAFPTLYEGFGFPGVEAMACGTPVVASDRSCLPEILGDAAELADPTDADAFGDAMLRVLRDPMLADRCRSRGLERAAAFTWERAARETVAVYREAAG